MSRRTVNVAASVLAVIATALVAAASPAAATPNTCVEVQHTVTGLPNTPGEHEIAGTLCASPADTAVQLLVPGATYNRSYWDFSYQPETYSYVHAMNQAGLATLAIDRLGTGDSSHPPSSQLTAPSHIEAVHQVVQALRNGSFGQQFTKVVLVGHSLGTLISIGLTVQHPSDVDGLIATGLSHGPSPTGLAETVLSLLEGYRANSEERFSHLDDGYTTTPPGEREFFYHLAAADPDVITVDEATKDTTINTEVLTATPLMLATLAVNAPVLAVVGEHDAFVCDPIPCSSPLNPWALEELMYLNATSFQKITVPDAGHNIQLHPNAHLFHNEVIPWVTSIIGAPS